MTQWKEDMAPQLKEMAADGLTAAECAAGLGLTESQVRYRAKKLGVGFYSADGITLRNFLAGGGRVVREELGGVVGVRWTSAHRSGGAFPSQLCDRLKTIGLLAPEAGTSSVYRLATAAA